MNASSCNILYLYILFEIKLHCMIIFILVDLHLFYTNQKSNEMEPKCMCLLVN